MATGHLIPPFPSDIGREAFGHWFSGFTDGEGCFWIGHNSTATAIREMGSPYRTGHFTIKLRADDAPILKLAQSFFQCGRFVNDMEKGCKVPNAKPQAGFTVNKVADLHNVIVPHFETYPLRAKKRRDFEIWKRAIAILHTVRTRRRVALRSASGAKWRGIRALWTPEEDSEFASLVVLLRETRKIDLD